MFSELLLGVGCFGIGLSLTLMDLVGKEAQGARGCLAFWLLWEWFQSLCLHGAHPWTQQPPPAYFITAPGQDVSSTRAGCLPSTASPCRAVPVCQSSAGEGLAHEGAPVMVWSTNPWNHRLLRGWDGPSIRSTPNPPAMSGHLPGCSRFYPAWLWRLPRWGFHWTTSSSLTVKNVFLISNLNFLFFNLYPLLLVQSLQIQVRILLWLPGRFPLRLKECTPCRCISGSLQLGKGNPMHWLNPQLWMWLSRKAQHHCRHCSGDRSPQALRNSHGIANSYWPQCPLLQTLLQSYKIT